MWPEWWQRSQPQLSTECATCQKAPSFLFIVTWKVDSRKNRTGFSSLLHPPETLNCSCPNSPLLNRHFFETPPRHFSLISFKYHANEGYIHDCPGRQEKLLRIAVIVRIAGSKVHFFSIAMTSSEISSYRWCRNTFTVLQVQLLLMMFPYTTVMQIHFNTLLSFWADTNLFSSNYLRLFYISGNIFDSFTLQKPMQIACRIGAKGIVTQQDLETEDQLIYLTENIYTK